MARSALQYRKQLQSLLPKGKLWNRNEDSVLTKLLYGMSDELVRVEERTENLINEKLLNTTNELLIEHENDFGLPEQDEELGLTLELRRNELKSKLIEVGQQDKLYFYDICLAFGYIVYIEEFKPAWCGIFKAGEPCGDQINLFIWKINIYTNSVEESIEVNLTKLINKINKLKPAHTHVLFDWYSVGFDRGFSRGFERFYHYDNYWVGLGFDEKFNNGFENNSDYYGVNFKGGFNYGFSIAYNRNSGGGFNARGFEKSGFNHPA
jgi:uncharacterized protein YmfQ (DUF2313 family)